jgi:hypothetical protein
VTIDRIGNVGEVIKGTFTAMLRADPAATGSSTSSSSSGGVSSLEPMVGDFEVVRGADLQ